ncbi:MAG: homocysteine S-methyltransferase family protein [Acidimicrobiia bacterium]|nr:homocysteine S-methyltransferase family protein [Acidimicrobiia bacterium]
MNPSPALPQLGDAVFLTDGGIETELIFRHGIDLPEFASFVLHDDPSARDTLMAYYRDYLRIGSTAGYGLVFETLTWRASADWGASLGYDESALRDVNRRSADFLLDLREKEAETTVVISGCVGPRGDAYSDLGSMQIDEAADYHRDQVEALAAAGVDFISALTLTNTAEAIGIATAAEEVGVPVAISFTVETDGTLPDGMLLGDAIAAVDGATGNAPSYYMINCAHPDHFSDTLAGTHPSLSRIRGLRANASRLSHAELDECEELDDGDPTEFGAQLAQLHAAIPTITVLGGCCGTDSRHIEAIATARALGG